MQYYTRLFHNTRVPYYLYADEENARPWNVVFGSEKANSTYTWKIN